ncbi:MAG: hypothetical protein NPIRA04_04860 [Nitrospirales bacterium]|nr:MAG: hypothetical protein NPIRA04_04860 [Nitrospirales bacterium]
MMKTLAPNLSSLKRSLPHIFTSGDRKTLDPQQKDSNDQLPREPLEVILAIIEEGWSSIDQTLGKIDSVFNPYGLQLAFPSSTRQRAAFLEWLGSWVGLHYQSQWSEAKARFIVSQAAYLYRYRGTKLGLEYLIALFFDLDVKITERTWPNGLILGHQSVLGSSTNLLHAPRKERCFVVEVQTEPTRLTSEVIKSLRILLDQEIPAHTIYYLSCATHEQRVSHTELIRLIIGQQSTIGTFYFDDEEHYGQ